MIYNSPVPQNQNRKYNLSLPNQIYGLVLLTENKFLVHTLNLVFAALKCFSPICLCKLSYYYHSLLFFPETPIKDKLKKDMWLGELHMNFIIVTNIYFATN
ncbi:hypothetical protein ACJX0J_040235, partial [Zea mays]